MTMQNFLTDQKRRLQLKIVLLLTVSYFFLGMTEGSFIWFANARDAFINFSFTVLCVASSWILFRYLHDRLTSVNLRVRSTITLFSLCTYITLLNWIYIELLWRESLYQTPFFSTVLPLSVPLFLSWSFGYSWLNQQLAKDSEKVLPETILVQRGKKRLRVEIDEVLGFILEHQMVFLIDKEGRRYGVDQNLSDLENQFSGKGFYRANRQLLITKNAVRSYQTMDNDKLEIELASGFPTTSHHTVSRYKASTFKKWLLS